MAGRAKAHGGKKKRPTPLSKDESITQTLAVDCEMVGVGPGGSRSKLASVSVVNESANQIYFSLCAPSERVTDYRTKVSGITKDMLVGAPSHAHVQQEVKELLQGRVVVGHDLRHDFGALGFHHPPQLIRDTARGCPRFLSRDSGRPRKLRSLTRDFLGLTIQDGEHCACEDAQAAMLLYLKFRSTFEKEAAAAEQRREARKLETGVSDGDDEETED